MLAEASFILPVGLECEVVRSRGSVVFLEREEES